MLLVTQFANVPQASDMNAHDFIGQCCERRSGKKDIKLLPEKNQKFQNYYASAVKTKAPWRLLVGLIIVIVVYFGFSVLFGMIVVFVVGAEKGPDVLFTITQGTDPKAVIMLLTTFGAMFIGVLMAVRLMHKRGLKSLLGPNISEVLRNFMIAFAIVVGLILASMPIFMLIDPPIKNMQLSVWLSWMLLGVPLLLLQVTSEELVFRGYMQQQLAAQFNSRWVWYVLPSVLFGMLHYDPETLGSNAWLIVAYTTLFGLITADVTTRTGNLGAAIGLHFANNLYVLAIVSLDGSVSGLGLYKTTFHVSDEAAIRSVVIPQLFFVLLLYGVYLFWCRNKPQL